VIYEKQKGSTDHHKLNVFNLVVTHGLYIFSAVYQVVCVNKSVIDITQRTKE